jgi:hypothetical protein
MPYQDILSRQDDLGKSHYLHEFLVKGEDLAFSKKKVLQFFERYQLVRYSHISIVENTSLPATSPDFEERLNKAILKNRQIVNNLMEELGKEGISTLHDLSEMPQGFRTKMLHVITHFLDGFFGIDTYFYNLEEDSHWVSEKARRLIREPPYNYWLLSIEAEILG